ncbi:solute carrier family 25, member 32b [Hyaloraphidium curvatum]|nr:solute carrier family 25, member 32b [Hyaloraphidium curvatum]
MGRPAGTSVRDEAIAGLGAGAISTLLLHPLDLIKTRLQIDSSSSRRQRIGGTMRAIRSVLAAEGSRGLYQGFSPNVVGAAVSWGVYFGWYEYAKGQLRARSGEELSMPEHLVAAGVAGCLTQVFVNPIWVVKTRMCAQKVTDPDRYRSLADAFVRMYRGEGFLTFYRGLIPALAGTAHGALQFSVYEELKVRARRWKGSRGGGDSLNTVDNALIAAASKTAATTITYPTQVLRSRLQVQQGSLTDEYAGLVDLVRKTARREGLYGFYKGFAANLIRVLPGSVVTLGAYEVISRALRARGASEARLA